MRFFPHTTISSLLWRLLPVLIAAGLIIGFWDSLLRTFGVGIALPILAVVILIWAIWQRRFSLFLQWWRQWLGAIAFAIALLGLLAFFTPGSGVFNEVSLGGDWGKAIIGSQSLTGVLRIIGIAIVGVALVAPRFTWRLLGQLIRWGQSSIMWLGRFYSQHPVHQPLLNWIGKRRPVPEISEKAPSPYQPVIKPPPEAKEAKISPREALKVPPALLPVPFPGSWQLPSLDLLDETAEVELSQAEVERRAKLIEEALASYGVEAKVVQMNVGPTITQFGVEPGWDRKYKEIKEKDRNGNLKVRVEEVSRTRVKVERITALANDLALALAAPSIRIEAPVPGKSIVGVEVPNSAMRLVSLREVMESNAFQKLSSKSKLALALGKGTASEIVVGDLAKMPHLLIAGTTGSGKTVCLNSIIASLLMNNTPDELQFIMIDPKRVELIAFSGVPHLMTPVITEKEKAVEVLKWGSQEMENRYRKLALIGAHNIEAYNKSSKAEKQMPYLIFTIDELADLMMTKEEVEPLLCRLAQMGRAIGIHLVVATQRPSVDVVTGLIKANFPTRISFAVASQVDSRTILDCAGAERLLGRGDMLYLTPEIAKPKRLQGCLGSPEEIERLVSFWSNQSPQAQPTEAFTYTTKEAQDPLLEQARLLAKEHKQISASFLQRQLHIGYPRAAQLMQLLQEEGIAEGETRTP